MKVIEFGSDPMDQFSTPIKSETTRFGRLLTLPVRAHPDKPGRELSVVWDARVPLVEGFDNCYSYIVQFTAQGNVAGNHYHKIKQEIYFPVEGEFVVILENPKTKERETIQLRSVDHIALFVPSGIAHVVRAETTSATLLVTATSPQVDRDEFAYTVL